MFTNNLKSSSFLLFDNGGEAGEATHCKCDDYLFLDLEFESQSENIRIQHDMQRSFGASVIVDEKLGKNAPLE